MPLSPVVVLLSWMCLLDQFDMSATITGVPLVVVCLGDPAGFVARSPVEAVRVCRLADKQARFVQACWHARVEVEDEACNACAQRRKPTHHENTTLLVH